MILCRSPGRFVGTWALHESISPAGQNYNLVSVAISNLRGLLKKRGIGSQVIESRWGSGYRITPEGARQVRALVQQ
jgi:DNA-binding response OmpR family regulator